MILELLIYGFTMGSVYAISALGLSLIYGVARVPNMAYGAFYTLSAYIAFILLNEFSLDFSLCILLSLFVTVAIAIASEKLLIKHILANPNSVIIATISLALFFEGFIQKYQKDSGYSYAYLPSITESVDILGIYISIQRVLIIVVFLVLAVGLHFLMAKTKVGMAIRAVAQNPEEAVAVGISKEKILTIAMGLSAAMAGITGILFGGMQAMSPYMGWPLLIKSLTIVTLGGLGSISGTIMASLILAYTEQVVASLSIGLISLSQFSELVSLILLIVILLFKPTGLLGKTAKEEEIPH